ncbi:MAG: TonB-dependent receptor [Cyclobacteriaceae bacterium]|nr:TonB-dependent receptor [Cyclobacteriaceae bacterium]
MIQQNFYLSFITKRIILFSFITLWSTALFAQTNVKGKITDENGLSMPGVNVVIKGTTIGTASDDNGTYSIQLPADQNVLVFSFIGYVNDEVNVDGRTVIDVKMSPDVANLSEVVIVGSRNKNRTELDSPVPVDIIDVSDIAAKTGKVEINQMLQYAAPSFNATKQSGSDGADHIDPASLRGLGPDQTLVLINGKRRHQSSLVNIFGTRGRGNSGTDLNALPVAAIKRIEILRDGASAQYGSDAIAGVINIVLKDKTDGISGSLTYGAYSTNVGGDFSQQIFDTQGGWSPTLSNIEGKNRIDGENRSFDGNSLKFDMNYGVPLGSKGGFANFTTEFLSKERTLRPSFDWREGYGSAAIDGFNFMLNSVIPLDDNTDFYAFGGRNFKNTNAYAFSRGSFADGDNRSVPSLYPNGFSPRITSNITDISGSVGVRHTTANDWKVDFNNTFGKNYFHYFIKGTNNASLGDASPTDFDAGGHSLSQNTTGLDFSKYYKSALSGINLAFGLEYRTENFEIFAGEESSYATYDINGRAIIDPANQIVAFDSNGDDLPGGSQGFPGYSPSNEVDRSRTNLGLYLDTEFNFTKDLMVGAAIRFEEYSDFGETFNGKLALGYKIGDNFLLRGSASTGFRAPSLAQIYYNLIFNNIVAGQSVPSLLSANNSTVTKAFGVQPLKQETATNISVGGTMKSGGFSATVDGYYIAVDDRIVLTDGFDASGLGLGVDAAQFFVNGVDTRTMGVDVVLGYDLDFGNSSLKVGLAGNYNKLEIANINHGALNEFTFFGPFSRAYLEAAAPKYKIGLNLDYTYDKLSAQLTVTQFSEVILQDFQWVDTPATTQAEADALLLAATDTYDAAMTLDFNVSYAFTKQFNLTIGGNNILNKYPTQQFDGWTDQGGFSDSVQMGTDGAYVFGRIGFNF